MTKSNILLAAVFATLNLGIGVANSGGSRE
jgi:hypothetical protein